MFFGYIDPNTGFTISGIAQWLVLFAAGFLGIFSLFFRKIRGFFKKGGPALKIILLITALAAILTGVIMLRKESKFNKKIVILGFDGLSPEIIEPMMRENKLPNFVHLKNSGSYRRLSTTNPPQSPVAWAGFSTGQNPGKNGIFDFIVRDPKTYALNLSLSNIKNNRARRVIKSRCFWEYTSRERIPTVVITCPVTFPADKIYGRMLSGMGVPDILGTEGTFTFYTTQPLGKNKDIGGNVFQVIRAPVMVMQLIGPRVALPFGKTDNVKVPFKVILKDTGKATIEYRGNSFELETGRWSDWQKVSFKVGLFREMKGIFKFYLVETSPQFKLYVSPINFDPENPFFPISYPKNYSKELSRQIGLYHTQGMPVDTWAVNEMRLTEQPLLEQINEDVKEKKAMLNFELGLFEKGVLFCYFETSDIIQHMFWRYTDPKHPLYEAGAPAEYKQAIENFYMKLDDILGEVIKTLNTEDTLIVLSDHGFNTFRRTVHLNTWLKKNGYLELKNPQAASGAELLADIDWPLTKAYAIGFGAIYINQRGREQKGIVKPGRETQLLKQEISAKLKGWHDEKDNRPIINNVYAAEEIFRGKYASETPDLYVGFNIGYRASWQTALGGVPEALIEDNLKKWSGDHLFDPELTPGVIFSNRMITKSKPSLYDIAPTVLRIAGYDDEKLKQCGFDGEPLF